MEHLQLYSSDSESCHSAASEEERREEGKCNSITSPSKPALNYFGLCDEQNWTESERDLSPPGEVDDSESEKAEKELLAVRLCSSGMEDAVSAEVPTSAFWKGMRTQDIQPGKCQQIPSSDSQGESCSRKHRHRSQPYHTQHRHHTSSVRTVISSSKSSAVQDYVQVPSSTETPEPVQTDSAEKRKIFFVHPKVANLLHSDRVPKTNVPTKVQVEVGSHSNAVNRVRWGVAQFSHLLLSASMDGEARVWSVWSHLDKCVRRLTHHTKAVKDAHWTPQGTKCLTCSYDRTAALCDIETGQCISRYPHQAVVSCGCFHPVQHSVFVTGSVDVALAWDVRQPGEPVRIFTYKDRLDMIQDVVFSRRGDQFFTSSGIVSRDSADRTLMAWDFSTGTILSNQIFQERYSCSRLRLHPSGEEFLAQTQGGYIALFSTERPYKMNKAKRFQGHQVQDYSIGFDVNKDGSLVASGSSDGGLYCYHYQTGRLWRKVDLGWGIYTDLAFHPLLPSTLAAASWGGGSRCLPRQQCLDFDFVVPFWKYPTYCAVQSTGALIQRLQAQYVLCGQTFFLSTPYRVLCVKLITLHLFLNDACIHLRDGEGSGANDCQDELAPLLRCCLLLLGNCYPPVPGVIHELCYISPVLTQKEPLTADSEKKPRKSMFTALLTFLGQILLFKGSLLFFSSSFFFLVIPR